MREEERQRWLKAKQQVLPFDFWEEEKKLQAERNQEAINNLPHFEEPANDNEYLLECQWQYKHGDKKALVRMYKRSRTICLKFINAIGQKNRHVKALSWEAKKIKAEDAATYVIEQYIKRPDFAIVKNYPGYLFLRIAHELYYMRKVDNVVFFVDIDRFFKEGDDEDIDLTGKTTLEKREVIKYDFSDFADKKETEEDQEQRELKQFYLWKQKNGGTK